MQVSSTSALSCTSLSQQIFRDDRCSKIGKFSVFTGFCGTLVGYSLFCKSDDFPTPEQQQNEHTRVYSDHQSTCNGSMGILVGALVGSVTGLALSVICFCLKELCSYFCVKNQCDKYKY